MLMKSIKCVQDKSKSSLGVISQHYHVFYIVSGLETAEKLQYQAKNLTSAKNDTFISLRFKTTKLLPTFKQNLIISQLQLTKSNMFFARPSSLNYKHFKIVPTLKPHHKEVLMRWVRQILSWERYG